jgi:hypothetical protein
MIKVFFRILEKSLAKLSDFFPFNLISDTFLIYKLDERKQIRIDNYTVYLTTPNFLTRYMHKTFFTKEPETLAWIDIFERGSVFYDVGANIGLYSIYAVKKNVPPGGCFKHVKSVDKKGLKTNLIIESRLYLARPVVFQINEFIF